VDFWLLNNVLLNEDGFTRSVFLYSPDGDRVFFGPAWDFEWGPSGRLHSK
jgi:hypothetical protein